jgi:DNA polymerase-3 subunit delta'
LLARYRPDLEADERGRLAAIAEGSPGRALALAEANGVALSALVAEVLGDLPAMTAGRAHAVADQAARDETTFAIFMDLLARAVAGAVRAVARGGADAAQAALISTRPLAAWVDVWQGLCRLQDETEAFHLDRRQAVVNGLSLLRVP